ncbi:hypothetical protein M0805_009548 [Coniferiporia weirii]|nr:hypothetical protein M0805_009548 [Coniferiporia weirii]
MANDLKALRDIISSSVDRILDVCTATGKDFPSLDEPIKASEFSPDGIRNHPHIADNISLIVAAAFQLIATVQPPASTLATSAFRFTLPVALGIVEAANVAEIIRPAGPKGMHVKDIASKSRMDPKRLARVLRFLATNHWFREVAPDVFAHNLLSSLLDTGKEITENFAATKHQDSSGLAALVGFGADEAIKSSVCMKDVLTNPDTAFSEEVNETGFQKFFGTNLSYWEYCETPEGQHRRERFSVAMSGSEKLQPPGAILSGLDWSTVPKGGLVVDVGGSMGNTSMEIARAFPEWNVVVEDAPGVISKAKHHWEANLPSHVISGKVHFIGCNFFDAQPVLPGIPDVFLLRQIVHDWSDKYVTKLLRRLRDAAGPSTKLVIVDSIIDYACDTGKYPLDDGPKAPAPLLSNMGGASLLPYCVDLVIMGCINSGERTIDGHNRVIEAGGWKLVDVQKNLGNKIWWPTLVAVPAYESRSHL